MYEKIHLLFEENISTSNLLPFPHSSGSLPAETFLRNSLTEYIVTEMVSCDRNGEL